MTPKTTKGLIIGGLRLATSLVVIYFRKQLKLLSEACYYISGGVVHALGMDNVSITIFLKVTNESDLTIDLSNMMFKVYVNKMYVTKIVKPEKQKILSKADVIIKLDFQFNPQDLLRAGLANIAPILYDKEKLVIDIKGSLSARTGIVTLRDFPIEESITLKEILAPSPDGNKCKKKTA